MFSLSIRHVLGSMLSFLILTTLACNEDTPPTAPEPAALVSDGADGTSAEGQKARYGKRGRHLARSMR